jgi:uncharacterized protein YbaA (DUF1428 family)
MSSYVDGFVIPVPRAKIEDYRKVAEVACKVWMDHGAIDYRECIGEDLTVKDMVSFPQLAGAGPEETVVFAWISYESREHRDAVNARVMEDPRMKEMMGSDLQLFDCKRMAYGGFQTIVAP